VNSQIECQVVMFISKFKHPNRSFFVGSHSPKKMYMQQWSHVEMGPPDPILGISVAFKYEI
jgi:hypothetical protein